SQPLGRRRDPGRAGGGSGDGGPALPAAGGSAGSEPAEPRAGGLTRGPRLRCSSPVPRRRAAGAVRGRPAGGDRGAAGDRLVEQTVGAGEIEQRRGEWGVVLSGA